MHCPNCQEVNQSNARFCLSCGQPFARQCTSCDAMLAPRARFCDMCGTPVEAGAPADPVVLTPVAVRKSVTAVFVDLVGSTAFGERLDPEAVRTAIAPYHELVRTTVEDHAGTLVKYMGDGALAVFGLPEVAEDDAIRAVSAGTDLQRRFRSFADDIRDRHGVELGLRVGINSGELVVAEDDADLVGDVLNTAARLEAACEPGEVLVGEDTWRLTRSVIEYEVLGEVRVKGKTEPIATFRVVDDDRAIADDIPFVGRQHELDELLEAFAEARDSPIARLVTVIGAPGVGKTRLAAELRAAVSARSFDLRFERRGSTTFTPIVQLLREITDGTIDGIARLLAGHADTDRLVPVVQSFLGHGQVRTTEEAFWAIRRLFEHLATDEPLIVVVDDIQWAEPLFWDLLDHLVEWAEAPVLIVALARPELRELRPELAQTGRRVAAAIALEGLDEAATRELTARLLDTDDLPGDLLERIPDSTEGNPLFVRELVQMLVDDGTLARDGDRWHLTIDADAIEVPPTILSLLASRVERLPDDERQVIELASVIGTDFDRGTLDAIATGEVTARLGALLDRLRRKDLIEPSGSWAGDHPVYRFHHVLIRDAAYRRLLKGRRAELHELVGRHSDSSGEPTSELDVIIAHHYEQTVRYRTELGHLDDATRALSRIAVERLHRAADDALDREDLPAAGGYARRALELADPEESVRDELLVVACEALLSSGDATGAAPMVRELHERSSDPRLAAWADCFRALRWSLTDPERLTEAADLANLAAGRLDELGDRAGVARARLVRATCLARLGRVGDCEAELDLALGAARTTGDRRRTVAVLGAAPLAALWGPSPVARAGGRCLDVLRLLRITTASPAVEATSIRCQGVLEALRGRLDSAREKLETSRQTARELGLRQGLYETELFAGWIELWAGDPRTAEPHLRAAKAGLGRLGIGADAGQAAALLALALLGMGHVDEAEALAGEALDTAGQNLQTAIVAGTALAEVRAAQGRHDEAIRLADEALDIAERTDRALDHALALLRAARVAETGGDATRARGYAERAVAMLEAKGVSSETVDVPAPSLDGSDGRDAALDRLVIDDLHADGRRSRDRELDVEAVAETRARFAELPEAGSRVDDDRAHADDTVRELIRNSSSVASEHNVTALVRRDREAMRQLYAVDFRSYDHDGRTIGAGIDVDELLTVLLGGRNLAVDARIADELLATRGDDLCLVRRAVTVGSDETVRLMLQETSSGLITRADWWEPDEIAEALDALDRRWIESGDAPAVAETDRIWVYAANTGDRARAAQLLSDDFVAVDRRPLGFGVRDRTSMLDTFVSHRDHRTILVAGYLDTHDRVALGVVTRTDGVNTTHSVNIAHVRDGRYERHETFAIDAVEEARARFLEITVGPEPEGNAAWRLARDFDATDDPHRWHEILHPDFAGHRRYLTDLGHVYSRDDWIAVNAGDVDTGADFRLHQELIAWRGEDIFLSRMTLRIGDDELPRHLVVRVADGLMVEMHMFDETQLGEALDELDRQWAALGGPTRLLAHTGSLRRSISHGDAAAVRPLLSPDFSAVDHRRLGLPALDRERYLAAPKGDPGTQLIAVEVLDHTERTSLERIRVTARDGWSEMEMLAVIALDDHGISHVDNFDVEDLAGAQRRHDELAGRIRFVGPAHRNSTVRSTHGGAEGNTAWRLTVAIDELADDPTRWQRILHPEFVETAHYRMNVGQQLDRDRFIDVNRAQVEQAERFDHSIELLAWRADELCLFHTTMVFDDNVLEYLVVVRSLDDRIVEMHLFDGAQLLDALDELDRMWIGLGGPVGHTLAPARIRRAFAALDVASLRECATDDFLAFDHRPLGVGVRNADQWAESMRPMWALDGSTTPIWRQFARCDEHLGLYRLDLRTSDGSAWDIWNLQSVVGDHLAHTELFDPDQFELALARFDELCRLAAALDPTEDVAQTRAELARRTAPGAPTRLAAVIAGADADGSPAIENETSRFNDVITAAVAREDDLELEAYYEPGFSFSGRRRSAVHTDGGIEHLAATVQYWRTVGITDVENRVVAVRDEHLALVETTIALASGDRLTWLSSIERGPTDRLRSVTSFDTDQLQEAMDELDRRWAATPERRRFVDRRIGLRERFATRDLGGFRAWFSPGAVIDDHRALGFGALTADEWVASLAPLLADAVGMTVFDAVIADLRAGVALTRHVAVTVTGDHKESWLIEVHDDDGVADMEWFELDDEAAARARFAQLTATSDADQTGQTLTLLDRKWGESGSASGAEPPSNRAVAVHAAIWRAVLADDRASLDELYHPDFRAASRRHGSIHWAGGREEILDRTVWWREHGAHGYDTEVLALRDDRLALIRRSFRTEDGSEHEVVILLETDEDGRLIEETAYDPDRQLGEALDELDRRWATTPEQQRIADDRIRLRAAFAARDLDAISATLHDDVEFVDHRAIGFGRIETVDEWLSTLPPFLTADREVVIYDVEIVGHAGDTCVTRHRTVDVVTGSTWDAWSVRRLRSDRHDLVEFFPLDRFGDARARFDELVAPERPLPRWPTWRAT